MTMEWSLVGLVFTGCEASTIADYGGAFWRCWAWETVRPINIRFAKEIFINTKAATCRSLVAKVLLSRLCNFQQHFPLPINRHLVLSGIFALLDYRFTRQRLFFCTPYSLHDDWFNRRTVRNFATQLSRFILRYIIISSNREVEEDQQNSNNNRRRRSSWSKVVLVIVNLLFAGGAEILNGA